MKEKWRKLHNEELYDLYTSPDIRAIKSRMRWVGYVARMADRRGECRFWVGRLVGKEATCKT
jgi:hypothetical protein